MFKYQAFLFFCCGWALSLQATDLKDLSLSELKIEDEVQGYCNLKKISKSPSVLEVMIPTKTEFSLWTFTQKDVLEKPGKATSVPEWQKNKTMQIWKLTATTDLKVGSGMVNFKLLKWDGKTGEAILAFADEVWKVDAVKTWSQTKP